MVRFRNQIGWYLWRLASRIAVGYVRYLTVIHSWKGPALNAIQLLRRLRNVKLPIWLFAVAMLLASCGSITPTAATMPPAQLSIQLDWTPNIDAAGFYVAQAKNYYADQGLTVKLLAGGYDAQGNYIDMIKTVLDGHADFGESSGIDLIQARAQGAPLVAIATIYQRHPLSFSSLAEKKIARPQDLIGKTVQIAPNDRLLFQALLTAQGIDPAQIKLVERTDFTSAPLIKGDADVIDAWVTNENVLLKLQGRAINTILPVDYGIEAYPNVIFTTEKMIAEHPDVVERFLRATLQGIQGAMDDPKSAAQLTKQYDATLDLPEQTEAMFQAVPFLNPAGSRPGMMTDKTWETTQHMMRDQGILKQSIDPKTAYTLAFLDKVYPK